MRKELQMDDPDVEEQRCRHWKGQFGCPELRNSRDQCFISVKLLQAAAKASVPDCKKPEPDASAAVLACPLPPQHPWIQSDVMFHIGALQQGGHATLQLRVRQRGGRWDHPRQQDWQHPGDPR